MPGVAADAARARLDVEAILARRDSFTPNHDDCLAGRVGTGAGIDVVRGRGRLAGERTVRSPRRTAPRTLTARQAVVLATGTTAAVPAGAGLREALPWTSRDVTNLHEVPRRVVVIGGGVVACESATWLRGLGAEEVTISSAATRLLGQRTSRSPASCVAARSRGRASRC